MPLRPLVLVALLLLVPLLASPPDALAASGLDSQVAPRCIFATPGGNATAQLTVTASNPSSPQNVTLHVVGSVPRGSNMTLTPVYGVTPLRVNVTFHIANEASLVGAYQVGVVATSGLMYHVTLFTLRVVPSQQSESSCADIGLALPDSTVVVTLTSLGLGLLTQTVTRRFVNLGAERRMKAEVAAFHKEKKEAALAKDKAKLEKLKKRELPMRQAQSKVQLARTKVTFITIVPLFLVYYLMASFLGGYGSIVAVSPIPIPLLVGSSGEMVLIWWYILGSFTLSSILGRLLHTTT